ncbi:MAG: DNA replication/repair protein RecF [Pseudomonadota bacterium]
MIRLGVSEVRLGRFRSYAAAALEAEGRSVALHGLNGAGKTNLLEAVSLLVPGRGLRRAQAGEFARMPVAGGWRVRAGLVAGTDGFEVMTGAEGSEGGRRVEIDGKPASQTELGRRIRMVWLTPVMDRLWLDGASGRRRFLDRAVLGFRPDHGEVSVAYERAMRERNRLLREPHADPAWMDGLEAQLARAGARIARGRAEAVAALVEAQAAAGSAFPVAELTLAGEPDTAMAEAMAAGAALDQAEAEQAAELAERLARGRPADRAAGRTLAGPHLSDLEAVYAAKGMAARACSTGEQKALLISLCLANARALAEATGATPVLLLDEVAAHLDADRRAALYGEIAALGAQAWMTGTGPELFEALGPGALRVAVSEGADGSVLTPA